MNLARMLVRTARRAPEAPAFAVGEAVVSTYAGFAGRVASLAGGLRGCGLAPGDRVAIAMSNAPAFYEALYGAWHAGLVAVPINARLHAQEFRYILGHSGSRLCLCTPELAGTIAGIAGEVQGLERVIPTDDGGFDALAAADPVPLAATDATSPAWLFYTSGTTGRPKGAILTHRNLEFMVLAYYADIDRLDERDTILHAAPMSHGSGLYGLAHVAQGGCNVIPASGHFDPAEVFALLRRFRRVSMFAAPTMVARLVRSPAAAGADLANLRTLVYGGGPMYLADLEQALALFGPRLFHLYGQGESPMTITGLAKSAHAGACGAAAESRLSTCGIARTAVEVRVVDDADRDLPPGAVGEVVTRSDCVMAGYWQDPDASAAALRGGWLHTGDLGSLDAEGYLTLTDRSKDLVISGGSNVYPREIEEVLLRHPGVVEAAVVGRPHPDWGEEVVACIVARADGPPSEPELDALCLASLARFKRPRTYRFVAALPKNNYGKVLKTELRAILARKRLDEARAPE